MTAPGLIGVLLRRQLSAHLVHSFTNTLRANRAGPRSIAERLAWLIDKILVHRADALHAVSADVGAQLRERFPRLALDVEIAPDLDVDARHDPHDSSVHILCSDRLAQADLRILTLGRIEPHKAHHVLLDALVLVIPARPGVHLVIAGDGRGREDLERRCAELGLAPNVTFIGETESPRTLIDWADVLVHCSLYEGLSRACLEALRRDLPVIAAATPASRELVRNYGQGAQLVPSGNSLALARRIERHPARPRQQPRLAPLAGASAVDRLLDLYTRVGGIAQ
jgi:glycosyltransferase involved in cell wall biosynthesis